MTLAGGGSGFISVGVIVRPHDHAAADFQFPGQPVEALASLPAAIDLQRDLLLLWYERLARPVEVEGVADDLGAHAERPQDQVDTRSGLGHIDDLRQHELLFWGFRSATVAL